MTIASEALPTGLEEALRLRSGAEHDTAQDLLTQALKEDSLPDERQAAVATYHPYSGATYLESADTHTRAVCFPRGLGMWA